MQEKNYAGAITVYRRNAQAFESNDYPPNYAWLADAYEKNGDVEKALKAYEKAYRLSVIIPRSSSSNPSIARAQIERLHLYRSFLSLRSSRSSRLFAIFAPLRDLRASAPRPQRFSPPLSSRK